MEINFIKSRITNEEDLILFDKAYSFAYDKLINRYRTDGKLLINYILQVINTLIDFKADMQTLIGYFLYETLKNGITENEILQEFDEFSLNLALTTLKISSHDFIFEDESQKFYLEQLSGDSPIDVRAILIKLTQSFYNLNKHNPSIKEYQIQLANETLNILIPIAKKLRLTFIKSKLEDLCLFHLNPNAYNEILDKLGNTPEELNENLNDFKNNILNLLNYNEINSTIKSRVKNFYSIYNKLMSGKKWEEIYDILAIRIIVDDISLCNKVIELIHSKYTFLPSRFKDYINNPKENMYQSLHTTIIDEDGKTYEIQVRTPEMNITAEIGSASHQLYKERTLKKEIFNKI